MKVSAILFDLDDTLINTSTTVIPARDKAFKAMVKAGLNQDNIRDASKYLERIVALFGSTSYKLVFEAIVREFSVDSKTKDLNRIVFEGIKVYEKHMENLKTYPDVFDTLDKIKASGIKIGLVSNGDHEVQIHKIKKCGLVKYFNDENTAISSNFGYLWDKPSPYLFEYMAGKIKTSLSSSIYIGNQHVDIAGANFSGMVGVLFLDKETEKYKKNPTKDSNIFLKLEKPDFLINKISRIFDVIEKLENS